MTLAAIAAALTQWSVITNADATVTTFSPYPSHAGEAPAFVVTNKTYLPSGVLTNMPHRMYRKTCTLKEHEEQERANAERRAKLKEIQESMRASRIANPDKPHARRPLLSPSRKAKDDASQQR